VQIERDRRQNAAAAPFQNAHDGPAARFADVKTQGGGREGKGAGCAEQHGDRAAALGGKLQAAQGALLNVVQPQKHRPAAARP
jgi:hypothetical protein